MDKILQLPLYGPIDHRDERLAWQLFQTQAFARLRDISLSSSPSRFIPSGQAASRFAHSAAVGMLGRRFADQHGSLLGHHRDVLQAACLCHDLGSPPFSHISEVFLYDATGRTHEQRTRDILTDTSQDVAQVLADHDVSAEEVVSCIVGDHPFLGALVAGSLDLDNLDNSLHLLLSLGHAPTPLPYHPIALIDEALTMTADGPALRTGGLRQVLGWAEARRLLYDVLYGEASQSSATMLYRALEMARAQAPLPDGFFDWGESRALTWLEDQAGPDAAYLVGQLSAWRHFPVLHVRVLDQPDGRITALYDRWQLRRDITDAIAAQLDVPERELCLYVGSDRGAKAIRLPWLGDGAHAASELFSGTTAGQRLAVYIHKRHHHRLAPIDVTVAVDEALAGVDEVQSAHAFF